MGWFFYWFWDCLNYRWFLCHCYGGKMNRTSTIPTSEAHWHEMRAKVLTSTDIATLFGYNPYQSLTKLWWLKKARQVDKRPDNEAMARGRKREPVIARLVAADLGRPVEPMKEFIQIPDLRQGSSFDARLFFGWGQAPLEIKSVTDRAFTFGTWRVKGDDITYAGPRVELQLQHEMKIANTPCIYLGVESAESRRRFVGRREASPLVFQMIDDKSGAFWKAFDKDTPPAGVTNRKPKQLRVVA